jgi:hypothetical protein
MSAAHFQVAVMAKYPEPGRVKARLAVSLGEVVAAELARAFIDDLAARLGDAGFAVTWAYWPPDTPFADLVPGATVTVQEGDDLGARMAGVVAALRQRADQPVVLLGADVPHIDLAVVRAAGAALGNDAEVVIGPAEDGGYYLLGTRRFIPALFEGIGWGGREVYRETLARCASLEIVPAILPSTFDVDEPADLERLATFLRTGVVTLPRTAAVLDRLGLR